jgi:hypothetical protein
MAKRMAELPSAKIAADMKTIQENMAPMGGIIEKALIPLFDFAEKPDDDQGLAAKFKEVIVEADLIEPDFFGVPGPAGPPSTAPGPAIFLEADVIEPDFFVVPGKDGAKGADGAPGTGGGGGASMPLGVAPDEIADEFIFVAPPQPTIVMFQQEISLGATALRSGKFTVTDARIKSSSLVICQVAAAAYTSKGVMTDEADLQGPIDFAVLPAAGSATVYWASAYAQYGNIKFNFLATAG